MGQMQPNKQVVPKTNKQQTHKRENKQENGKEPRSKQTSMDLNITHEKEQTCHKQAKRKKKSKPFIETWMYGCRPRPLDVDLHPTQKPNTRNRHKQEKQSYKAPGIASKQSFKHMNM